MDYLNLTYRMVDHNDTYNTVLNLMADQFIKKLIRNNYSQKTTSIANGVIIQIWKDQTKSRVNLPALKDCLYTTPDLLKQAMFNLDLGIPLSVLHTEGTIK